MGRGGLLMSDLKIAMLSNGDQILGKFGVSLDPDEYYTVEDVVIMKTFATNQGVGSIPLMFPSKERQIKIRKDSLCISPVDPLDELKEMHLKLFSNIVLPKVNVKI
jgi:hypothetical protein